MKPVYFFLGGDTAPSESHRSDHGAAVVGAAWPRRAPEKDEPLSEAAADWNFGACYSRVFTHKHKLSARQWSGFFHQLHGRFGFEKMVLDAGAGGGGVFVAREMRSAKQLIAGVETAVTPIGDQMEAPRLLARAQFILHLFKRGDPGIDLLWPDSTGNKSLAGDELLKDSLFGACKDALDHQGVMFPAPCEEWLAGDARERIRGWNEERVWAVKNLDAATQQLKNITVATKEDGTMLFTKRGAHVFDSRGKDDIAMAWMYCYTAFLIWLRSENWRASLSGEDAVGFLGG